MPADAGFHPPYRTERRGFRLEINGFTHTPARVSAENGALFRAAVVAGLVRAFVEFYRT